MLVGSYPFEDPVNFQKTISVSSLCSEDERFVDSVQDHVEITSYSQQQILSVQYSIPDFVRVSQECRQLLSRFFVADPSKVSFFSSANFSFDFAKKTIPTRSLQIALKRITIAEIKKHPWFWMKLPKEIIEDENTNNMVREQDQLGQSIEEIMSLKLEAKKPAEGSEAGDMYVSESVDSGDAVADADTEGVDNSD